MDWPPELPESVDRGAFLADTKDGVCPFCGRDSLLAVGRHFNWAHDVSTAQVREHYGFNRHQTFAAEVLTGEQSRIMTAQMADPERRASFVAGADRTRDVPCPPNRPQRLDSIRRATPEERQAIVRMYDRGMRSCDIAESVGESTTYISKILRWEVATPAGGVGRGQPYRRYDVGLSQEREILARFDAGEHAKDLAREYGLGERRVFWFVRKRKLAERA